MGRHNSAAAQRSTGRAGVRVRALLSLGMVAGLGAVGTLAAWSDEATATATFSSGSLDLTLNGDVSDAIAPTSLSMSNIYPGSSKAAVLTVANAGTLPFTYNFTASSVDNAGNTASLSSALVVVVYPGGFAGDGANCAGTIPIVGAVSFNSSPQLSSARRLAPVSNEQLCIHVSLPGTADNKLQNMGTTAKFTFTADQVK